MAKWCWDVPLSTIAGYGSGIPTSEYHSGVEHMADCIADAMGAQRTGMLDPYTTYYSGYGGKCTSAHLAKSRTIIAGKRP